MNNLFDSSITFDSIKFFADKGSSYAELCLNRKDEIIESFNLLNDEHSQGVYLRELFFYILSNLSSNEFAHMIAGHPAQRPLELDCLNKVQSNNLYEIVKYTCEKDKLRQSLALYVIFILEQYVYNNNEVKISPETNDICIDAGACIGETAIWMLKQCHAKKIYAMELLEENLRYAKMNLKHNNITENKVKLIQAALSNKNTIDYFIRGDKYTTSQLIRDLDSYSKKYGTDNLEKVQSVSVDNLSEEEKFIPNFIKMDIEGAEALALRGCENVISNYQPKLAISAYHKPEDLFELPLLINKLNPKYKLFLDHKYRSGEMILFAINF